MTLLPTPYTLFPMKRHVALRGLSSDHHHGLVHARRLARAAAGREKAETIITAYLAFAAGDLARHFREEEEILLPEFARWAGADDPLIARTVVAHVALRERTLALRRAEIEGIPLKPLLADLAQRLEAHIRFEERELFPAVERALPQERMAAVGVLLAAGLPGS
jgi:iron-sulfur cluster repair protein YtfE (RIC family)